MEAKKEIYTLIDNNINNINYCKQCVELGIKIKREGYKIINTINATDANADWANRGYTLPPVAKDTKAYNVEAGEFEYVRVYREGINKAKSPFLLRADDIKGLGTIEIAEKYALPQEPNRIVYLSLPKDTILEVSIVGPQKKWGTVGGNVQYAIKDNLLDDDWFANIHSL